MTQPGGSRMGSERAPGQATGIGRSAREQELPA